MFGVVILVIVFSVSNEVPPAFAQGCDESSIPFLGLRTLSLDAAK